MRLLAPCSPPAGPEVSMAAAAVPIGAAARPLSPTPTIVDACVIIVPPTQDPGASTTLPGANDPP